MGSYFTSEKDNSVMADKNIRSVDNPLPKTSPPSPPGTNWPARKTCEKMTNSELESLIREAQDVLNQRKNERANKLIEKVCTALNELKMMGNVEFEFYDYDECCHNILDEVGFFDASLFKIRG